jgi:hypothetical protein
VALTGISADGPADAWAVGFGRGSTTTRYSGTAWVRVPTPTVNGARVMTDDVSALAPDDVWMLADEPTSTDRVGPSFRRRRCARSCCTTPRPAAAGP